MSLCEETKPLAADMAYIRARFAGHHMFPIINTSHHLLLKQVLFRDHPTMSFKSAQAALGRTFGARSKLEWASTIGLLVHLANRRRIRRDMIRENQRALEERAQAPAETVNADVRASTSLVVGDGATTSGAHLGPQIPGHDATRVSRPSGLARYFR